MQTKSLNQAAPKHPAAGLAPDLVCSAGIAQFPQAAERGGAFGGKTAISIAGRP